MTHPLLSAISQRRAEATALRRQADQLDAQAEGMEFAVQFVNGGEHLPSPAALRKIFHGGQALQDVDTQPARVARQRDLQTDKPRSSSGRVAGAISRRWQDVFKGLYDLGSSFSAQDVSSMIDMLESRVMKPSAVRRHFDGYITQGFIGLESGGKYVITPAAIERFSLKTREPSEPVSSNEIEPLNGSAASGSIGRDYQSLPFSQPAPQA